MPFARTRLVSAVLAVLGAFLGNSALILGLGWGVVVAPLLLMSSIFHLHVKFLVFIVAPVAGMLFVVWGLLMGAPPGEPMGSDLAGAVSFAALTSFRLAFLGGVAQLCFLTIPRDRLAITFRHWGLHSDWLIIVLGTYVLGPELRLRSSQLVAARLARGLNERSVFGRIRQLPLILVPLFAWVMRSALQRAETWRRRMLLDRIRILAEAEEEGSTIWSVALALTTIVWVGMNAWSYVYT